jgi:hypothetical protein
LQQLAGGGAYTCIGAGNNGDGVLKTHTRKLVEFIQPATCPDSAIKQPSFIFDQQGITIAGPQFASRFNGQSSSPGV